MANDPMKYDLSHYQGDEEPRITKHEGLIHVSWGGSNVFGDREHVHALMMILKKALSEDRAIEP